MPYDMSLPRVPMRFVAGIAELPDMLISLELLRGRSKAEARAVAAMIPAALRGAPCFLDRMTGLWLYDFGDPVMTGQGFVYGGGETWHRLTRLIDVIGCAHARLDPSTFADYVARLEDPTKHADLLFEFAPVLRLDPTTTAQYEVIGESPGNRSIDWKIAAQDGFAILLEVKRRAADFISSIERIASGERAIGGTVPAPEHDTDLLFRSVEAKFLSRRPDETPQGAWIGTALMQEASELEQSFLRLDPTKVHFALLATWDGDVHLLSREGVPRAKILQLLRVREVDRLVFNRPDDG